MDGGTAGTAAGALFGSALGDYRGIGLDAALPAFFLCLLLDRLSGRADLIAGILAGRGRRGARALPAAGHGPRRRARRRAREAHAMRWEVIAAVAALCIALRVAAPLLLHGRQLPGGVEARPNGAIVPLLGALIAIQLFVHLGRPDIDARAAGVGVAAAVFVWRRSFVGALLVTAGLRQLA